MRLLSFIRRSRTRRRLAEAELGLGYVTITTVYGKEDQGCRTPRQYRGDYSSQRSVAINGTESEVLYRLEIHDHSQVSLGLETLILCSAESSR